MSGLNLFGEPSEDDDGKRSDFDYYSTPEWMSRSLLHNFHHLEGKVILECCSGRNAITNVLELVAARVITNDIDPRHELAALHEDATSPAFWKLVGRGQGMRD